MANGSIEIRVREFISEWERIPLEKIELSTYIERDLGITGDDAEELIVAFQERFQVELSSFRFDQHFYPEVSLSIRSFLIALGAICLLSPIGTVLIRWGVPKWGTIVLLLACSGTIAWKIDISYRKEKHYPLQVKHLVEAAKTQIWQFSYK